MNVELAYRKRYPQLKLIGQKIDEAIREMLEGIPRIDAISVRAKSVERFVEKASRKSADGSLKYANPLDDIQDQIGARIVVFYKSDVDAVTELVVREFNVIEDRTQRNPHPEHFGYEAKHNICFIPLDISKTNECPIEFFELQVSTLFQHAWAEANHDLGYKPGIPIDFDAQRRIAWAAAQAWGADTVFDELWQRHNN